MNYLAHSYLSFSDEQIAGQFLQDHIRNSDRFSFSKKIQQGIALHRAIDTFTDSHPEIHQAKKIFSPLVRLYAGAFVDVAMDYFLANSLPDEALHSHSLHVYKVLRHHQDLFPPHFGNMLNHMERDNWLYHYKEESGIRFSMQNVLNKARYLDIDLPVFQIFSDSKPRLKEHFDAFFPDLTGYVSTLNESFQHTDRPFEI
ncbi:ACP phosphodiesterase [Chryseobacterium sp. MFBS3-17]|uniref:acyl carrier protein phosphodiesterase n=1 Tax=Chryseobacterium sp. MFBS3-17 TaxID=2886689 RepID=UPI001D0E69AD|nr:ACP phosphodiesterase [Chryseobacterium sp. MFBS3-17]MCC2590687.1 ACP phosphodiesterase [Chryseobacterium sp. MFBS3-17]